MKNKWRILFLILIIVATGCKKKEEDVSPVIPEESGAIFVTVIFNGQPIPGAEVSINPGSEEGITGASGNLMLEDISEGIYQVFATHDEIGSGSGAVSVDPGDVSNVTIQLVLGVFEGPMVDIITVNPLTADVGDTISVTVAAFDNIDAFEDINFEWSTDVDGVISTEGVSSDGYGLLKFVFATEGERLLTVTVTNSEGNSDSDERAINIMELPDSLVLDTPEYQNYALHLNWSQSDAENFMSYRVYRQAQFGMSLIEMIYDINTTSYVDSELTLGTEYSYQIGMVLEDGTEIMSNIETVQYDGEYIYIGTGLDMMRHDPNNPIIYGLDTDNNTLLFINTELNEVVNSIFVGSFPTDMDFSMDNQLLYVANYGSTEITVVDLASQSVQSTFFVETNLGIYGGNPYTLAVMANGLLAFSSEDQWNNIKLVDINTGDNVFTTSQAIREPYLASSSDGTRLYVGETGSAGELLRYDLVNDELVLLESSSEFGNSVRQVFLTNNDEFVFCAGRKFLANNVPSLLGTFGSGVYAINSNGTWALGEHHVFSGNEYNIVTELPLSTKVSVFGNDDIIAYLYHEQTARLYKFSIE